MTAEPEQWRPVAGFEGSYAVSDHGRVKSIARRVEVSNTEYGRKIPERIRKVTTLPNGYRQVQLFQDGATTARLVHRLVLEAFIGPCPDGMEALHGDAGQADNSLSNLRWGSHEDNVAEALAAGTHVGSVTRCPHGHEYTPANTYITIEGSRACRSCARRRNQDLARAKKAGLPDLHCLVCKTVIPRPSTRGAPPKWCSEDCRRTSRNARLRERYTNRKETIMMDTP